MYFTNTPFLNSMEAIMKQPPGYRQRGGGRKRKPYQYTKADCSCRLCPHYQGKRGCAVSVCPVLDIRLECSAAPLEEAVQSTFSEVTHTPFKQRLQRIYKEKRGGEWLPYQNSVHQKIFETESLKLRCSDNKSLAVLYLLTADHTLWSEARRHTQSGQISRCQIPPAMRAPATLPTETSMRCCRTIKKISCILRSLMGIPTEPIWKPARTPMPVTQPPS